MLQPGLEPAKSGFRVSDPTDCATRCSNIDIKKQPAANIVDGNVQLHVLSHIPDIFQSVTEIVSDCLPKPSRVNTVTVGQLYDDKSLALRARDLIFFTTDLQTVNYYSTIHCWS